MTAVSVDDRFGNGETKPIVFILTVTGDVNTIETLKDFFALIDGDFIAFVNNRKNDRVSFFSQG